MTVKRKVVFILVDELFADFLHDPVVDEVLQIPNIRRLMELGCTFTSAITNAPICCPSRTAIHTGESPYKMNSFCNATPYRGESINPNISSKKTREPCTGKSWAHVCRDDHGLKVYSVGKLHLVGGEKQGFDNGFTREFIAMHVEDQVGQTRGLPRNPVTIIPNVEYIAKRSGEGIGPYHEYDILVTKIGVDLIKNHTVDVVQINLLETHFPFLSCKKWFDVYKDIVKTIPKMYRYDRNGDTLFHEWVSDWMNVVPGYGTNNTLDEADQLLAAYFGMISTVDENIGSLVDAMESVGMDNMTVILTSDHGELATRGRGSRENEKIGLIGKSMMYAGSTAVPLIVVDRSVESDMYCKTPVDLTTIFSTIIGTVTESHTAKSLVTIANSPDDLNVCVTSHYDAFGANSPAFMVRDGYYQLNYYMPYNGVTYEPELYDIRIDPLTWRDISKGKQWLVELYKMKLFGLVPVETVKSTASRVRLQKIAMLGGREAVNNMGMMHATRISEDLADELKLYA